MATLSPSKPRTTPDCRPTPVQHERSSPQRTTFVPRSALPEPGSQDPAPTSPSSASLSAMQAIQAFKNDDARDGTFVLPTERLRKGMYTLSSSDALDLIALADSPLDPEYSASSVTSTLAHGSRGSDEETVNGSSEASIEIITERDTAAYSDVRSASPRKPLPAQWFPLPQSPPLTTSHRTGAYGDTQASPNGSPIERRAGRTTRSSIDLGKPHAETPSFLTKEALDAVDADITSPTLRRSPSKIQRSSTRVPWNSSTKSPKVESLRHSGASPTKPSPPRTTHLGTHVTADHRRAPSSIVSTGATSFHTAHGSPVRSSDCSQSSFSSTGDVNDSIYFHCPDYVADVGVEQIDHPNSKAKAVSMTGIRNSLRPGTSRPELSIRIPPSDASFDVEQRSASTIPSATSSTAASFEEGSSPLEHFEGHHGTTTQSRIPRVSASKGSSARAPTLSSTLKQTKSTQTLRLPKATKGKTEPKAATVSKANGTKSLRHVRTVDSTGSTPILSNRKAPDLTTTASYASVATTNTQRTARARDVDLLTSYLQDTALEASESPQDLPASSTASRATSSSTVKASQVTKNPATSDSTDVQSRKGPDFSGTFACIQCVALLGAIAHICDRQRSLQ
jgi:hypothetical protein